jgi:hypothetical protein
MISGPSLSRRASQLDGRQPTSAADSDCAALAFRASPQRPCTDAEAAGGVCLTIEASFSVAAGAADRATGPTTYGFVTAGRRNSTLVASAQIAFRRAPRLLSATFSSGYGRADLACSQRKRMDQKGPLKAFLVVVSSC